MMNLELHVVRNWADSSLAEKAGIITFDNDVPERCANCNTVVGPRDDDFIPCVIVFEDDDDDMYYTVCTKCAKPVIDPNE